jgi:hypothetical protein
MSIEQAERLLKKHGFTATLFVGLPPDCFCQYESENGTEVALIYRDSVLEKKWLKQGTGVPSRMWREAAGR